MCFYPSYVIVAGNANARITKLNDNCASKNWYMMSYNLRLQ